MGLSVVAEGNQVGKDGRKNTTGLYEFHEAQVELTGLKRKKEPLKRKNRMWLLFHPPPTDIWRELLKKESLGRCGSLMLRRFLGSKT
jgi:hypothetical protein